MNLTCIKSNTTIKLNFVDQKNIPENEHHNKLQENKIWQWKKFFAECFNFLLACMHARYKTEKFRFIYFKLRLVQLEIHRCATALYICITKLPLKDQQKAIVAPYAPFKKRRNNIKSINKFSTIKFYIASECNFYIKMGKTKIFFYFFRIKKKNSIRLIVSEWMCACARVYILNLAKQIKHDSFVLLDLNRFFDEKVSIWQKCNM